MLSTPLGSLEVFPFVNFRAPELVEMRISWPKHLDKRKKNRSKSTYHGNYIENNCAKSTYHLNFTRDLKSK